MFENITLGTIVAIYGIYAGGFVVGVLPVVAWWKILTRAGYPGAFALVWLVPVAIRYVRPDGPFWLGLLSPLAALALLFAFAFADWPVLRGARKEGGDVPPRG
jgi:hypothetical protein